MTITASTRRSVIVAALYGWLTTCAVTGALIGHGIHRAIRNRKERP